jgi:hypothetical protein
MGSGWTEFWRKNKRLCQILIAVLAVFGIEKWAIFWQLCEQLISNRLFSSSWWSSPIWLLQPGTPGTNAVLRAMLFAVVGGIFINGYFSYRHRNSPLTLLSTSISLRFSQNGKKCTTRRVQRFRANRPGVRAYYMKISTEAPKATMPRNELEVSLGGNPANKNGVALKTFGNPRSWELVCEYETDLPYSWFLPFIPGFCLRGTLDGKPNVFKRFITEHRIRSVTLDEYDQPTNRYQIVASRYDHQSIAIELDFSDDAWKPDKDHIQAIRRLSNAVFKISVEKVIEKDYVYRVEIDALQKDEILSVSWDRPQSQRVQTSLD